MGFYDEMLASIERRERDLRLELDRLRHFKDTVRPLLEAAQATEARTGPTNAALVAQPASSVTIGGSGTPMVVTGGTSPARTLVEAAQRVLVAYKKPMHIQRLVEAIQAMGFGKDRTPDQLRASLTPTLLRRSDLFRNVERGIYAVAVKENAA